MKERGKKYLSDILISLGLIESFSEGLRSFEEYTSDLKTQSAIERQLGIIGEAMNKFQKEFPEITIAHAKQIIGLRNRIIHSYDSIDNAIVWAILKNHLAPFREEILTLEKQINSR